MHDLRDSSRDSRSAVSVGRVSSQAALSDGRAIIGHHHNAFPLIVSTGESITVEIGNPDRNKAHHTPASPPKAHILDLTSSSFIFVRLGNYHPEAL